MPSTACTRRRGAPERSTMRSVAVAIALSVSVMAISGWTTHDQAIASSARLPTTRRPIVNARREAAEPVMTPIRELPDSHVVELGVLVPEHAGAEPDVDQ